jgi:YfiH family protein
VIELSLNGARVAFSDRHGGVSGGPYDSLNLGILTEDDQQSVSENRRRLAGSLGLDPAGVAMGWQVHGNEIRQWDAPPEQGGFAHAGADLPKVDGHMTTAPGVALLVLVADCLPLALVSSDRVAMLHCGWRGLAAGIVESALDAFPEPPRAVLGPAIEACCYEVGPEVVEQLGDVRAAMNGRNLSLRQVAMLKLYSRGVKRIDSFPACTSCRPDLYFSHRRDGGATGRQAGLVWLT